MFKALTALTALVAIFSTQVHSACLNNEAYRYMERSCATIRFTQVEREEFCLIDEVREECPQTCGICCEDDLDFTFELNIGTEVPCAWLTWNSRRINERKERYCSSSIFQEGTSIQNACPLACDICQTLVVMPSTIPSPSPTGVPSTIPTKTVAPSPAPTSSPQPSHGPTLTHSMSPSGVPTGAPSSTPSGSPIMAPTAPPTVHPTPSPTPSPSASPSTGPTTSSEPTKIPTVSPTKAPTPSPTSSPSAGPTVSLTVAPSPSPTSVHSVAPTVSTAPSIGPCIDDSSFFFKLDIGTIVDCSWLHRNISNKAKRIEKYCPRFDIKSMCRYTCNFCTCEDDPDFTFPVDKGFDAPCSWLTKNFSKEEQRKGRYCHGDVASGCAGTCGLCD